MALNGKSRQAWLGGGMARVGRGGSVVLAAMFLALGVGAEGGSSSQQQQLQMLTHWDGSDFPKPAPKGINTKYNPLETTADAARSVPCPCSPEMSTKYQSGPLGFHAICFLFERPRFIHGHKIAHRHDTEVKVQGEACPGPPHHTWPSA